MARRVPRLPAGPTAGAYVAIALVVGGLLWVITAPPGLSGAPTSPVGVRLLALVVGAALGGWIVFETVRNAAADEAA